MVRCFSVGKVPRWNAAGVILAGQEIVGLAVPAPVSAEGAGEVRVWNWCSPDIDKHLRMDVSAKNKPPYSGSRRAERTGPEYPRKTREIRGFSTKALHNPVQLPMWGFWRPNWPELSPFGRYCRQQFAGRCWRWWSAMVRVWRSGSPCSSDYLAFF
jgi:hypothetical protein